MGFDFLETLEQRVRKAGEELTELRDENAALRARTEELERELEASRDAGEVSQNDEREQDRRRVDRLSVRLAELLEQ